MNLLVLAERDPDGVVAGSGTVRSVVKQLRAAGHEVLTGDAELYGARWLVGALASFAPSRRRWGAQFRTGRIPFRMRSRRAAASVDRHGGSIDAIFQYGSTFRPRPRGGPPYFLYMDSCMRIAAGSAQSWAGALTPHQVERVIEREQGVYEGASGIFTFSEGVRRVFISELGLSPERVVTTYAGPNLDLSEIPDRSRLRRSPGSPTILFIGREFKRKGGDLLLEAFGNIRGRIPGARLVMVGPKAEPITGPGVTNLGFLRKDNPGELKQLVEAYRSADVFCFPTRYEPFGIVILEAMLFGLPCVATRTGAMPELIVEGETGFLVPRDDVTTLSDRLLALLANPVLATRFGENAQRRAEQHFTWPAVVSRMLDVIRVHLDRRER